MEIYYHKGAYTTEAAASSKRCRNRGSVGKDIGNRRYSFDGLTAADKLSRISTCEDVNIIMSGWANTPEGINRV